MSWNTKGMSRPVMIMLYPDPATRPANLIFNLITRTLVRPKQWNNGTIHVNVGCRDVYRVS
jgi:hypothetical protein